MNNSKQNSSFASAILPSKLLWLDLNASYQHVNVSLPALHAQVDHSLALLVKWDRVYAVVGSPREEVLQNILDRKPRFIMATAWLFTHDYLLSLLQDIKSLLPHVVIVLGGPEFLGHSEANHDYLLAHPFVSYLFRGEGEDQINNLLRALLGQGAYSEVTGLCYIDSKTNQYIDNGCATTAHFESLKAPEESSFFEWQKAFVQLETSRGCFNTCAFCVSGRAQKIQNVPVERLRGRLDKMVEMGVTHIRVLDRTFNANPTRAVELLELFRTYEGKLHFHLEIHPAFLNTRVLDVMTSMPPMLLHVEAGIQSLDDHVLETCRRKGTVEQALKGLHALMKERRFAVHTDLIIGLPHYTYKQLVKDTLQLLSYGVDEIQMELLKCLPGTEFRENASAYSLRYSLLPPYRVLETDVCSYAQLNRAMVLSKIIDQWYNPSSERELFCMAVTAFEDFLEAFIDYYVEHALSSTLLSKESRYMHLYSFCEERFPSLLPQVSFYWVRNGFSLKKKPGLCFQQWKDYSQNTNREKSSHEQSNQVHFYATHTTSSGVQQTYAVSFDKTLSRSVPQSWLKIEITNLF